MPAKISMLIDKLKRQNPELQDSPLLDQIEAAAYEGDEGAAPMDGDEQPGPMDEGDDFDMGAPDDESGGEPPAEGGFDFGGLAESDDEADDPFADDEVEPERPMPKGLASRKRERKPKS